MNVFQRAVLASLLICFTVVSGAWAGWSYPVDSPNPPKITRRRELHNPTVAEIQAAIAPQTRIDIIGNVQSPSGAHLNVSHDDVWLNFNRANEITWSGGDTWNGFVNVDSRRLRVTGLRLKVAGNSGRCRGIQVYTYTGDIQISDCRFQNVSDGFIVDGEWERIAVERTQFLDCSDWANPSMDGGYGMFFEDDDQHPDHVRISDVTVSLSNKAGQHGIRISQVQNLLIENCRVGANNKRSLWVYGVDRATIRNSIFDTGSVMFNIKTHEPMTDRPLLRVRLDNCKINHRSIMTPLQIYCGQGTANFYMRNVDITSTTSSKAMEISWRENGGSRQSKKIRWFDGTITFNGQPITGMQHVSINDWSNQERAQLKIGPIVRDDSDDSE